MALVIATLHLLGILKIFLEILVMCCAFFRKKVVQSTPITLFNDMMPYIVMLLIWMAFASLTEQDEIDAGHTILAIKNVKSAIKHVKTAINQLQQQGVILQCIQNINAIQNSANKVELNDSTNKAKNNYKKVIRDNPDIVNHIRKYLNGETELKYFECTKKFELSISR